MTSHPFQFPHFEAQCNFAEMFVLEQSPHELGARIFQFTRFVQATWQQHLRFYAHERGCHFQKFTGQVQTEVLNLANRQQKLLGDLCNRNIENIDILLANQMQQQIERTLETIQLNKKRGLVLEDGCGYVHSLTIVWARLYIT